MNKTKNMCNIYVMRQTAALQTDCIRNKTTDQSHNQSSRSSSSSHVQQNNKEYKKI
ncbi:unknown [Helicoverpa armigera nucleopolyhedrovirus]|uniref:Uncharacterized protein n=4 Tax=Alphabaculovirus helarmigerae TaxID=3047947 RepID=Q77K99_9ABAC|nr:hypothetical protein HanGV4gp018 [Helicoverpa armigera nucleopolyhedrovirus G4]NP_203574.1 hypothetical protein [Helicoverpa armigera nucleopolyhedrovirus]AAL56162.1 ORF17 [Helicoverpa zea single nucleopolyhedrovirus]AEN03942.1 hypothetical protein [Helicoverpa armigera NPV strain Australia]AIG63196.1 ORF17 [Helicoverpa armigera SNPV]AXR98008.1 hypothetical protein [Helicoverpa assulta nucleopolyhedrovirus]BAG74582.1 hypothetical protein [Helicoverpa armigera NPV NNg1]